MLWVFALTLRDESFSDLPGEDGGVFPFVLLDFGDDGGGGDLGLAAPDEAWGPERPGDTCGAHRASSKLENANGVNKHKIYTRTAIMIYTWTRTHTHRGIISEREK